MWPLAVALILPMLAMACNKRCRQRQSAGWLPVLPLRQSTSRDNDIVPARVTWRRARQFIGKTGLTWPFEVKVTPTFSSRARVCAPLRRRQTLATTTRARVLDFWRV
jgi:hypothetical protein